MAKENTLTILSANYLKDYKKDEVAGVLKLATDIGLEIIRLSEVKNSPIRMNTYEETKGKQPRVIFNVEIDLEKPLREGK